MKLKIGLGVVVLSAFSASLAFGASIVGSKHDMNVVSNPDIQGRVCAFCHTPHHAQVEASLNYNPLWSHTVTTQTFTPYTSTTLQASNPDPLSGNSRLCMSCHDGAIAVDQHYGTAGTDLRTGDGWGQIAVGAGGNLTNDHPIGFDYALVGGTVSSPGTTPGLGGGSDPEIRGTATPLLADPSRTIADLMEQRAGGVQIMTCGSCHDVHGTSSVPGRYFLIGNQAGSQICLTCHIK